MGLAESIEEQRTVTDAVGSQLDTSNLTAKQSTHGFVLTIGFSRQPSMPSVRSSTTKISRKKVRTLLASAYQRASQIETHHGRSVDASGPRARHLKLSAMSILPASISPHPAFTHDILQEGREAEDDNGSGDEHDKLKDTAGGEFVGETGVERCSRDPANRTLQCCCDDGDYNPRVEVVRGQPAPSRFGLKISIDETNTPPFAWRSPVSQRA